MKIAISGWIKSCCKFRLNKEKMNPGKTSRTLIKPRKIDFGFTDQLPYKWYNGNPAIFTLCNVISIMFPVGEQFFIDSVRYYKDKIKNPALLEEMAGFIAQEAMHSKQHDLCNQLLKTQHKQLVVFEKNAQVFLDRIRRFFPARTQLAVSCALEHFTALFAHQLLATQSFKNHAHPVYAKLWIWHAIEETEHKAVCYDVYQHVAGGPLGYVERCLVMLSTSLVFLAVIMTGFVIVTLSKPKKKIQTPEKKNGVMTGIYKMFFSKEGLVREIMIPYLAYYLPFFHPWKQDNSQLIKRWKAEYENGLFRDADDTLGP